MGQLWTGSHRPAAAGGAPRQYDVLHPYLSFGWLPHGETVLSGDLRPHVTGLDFGRPHNGESQWELRIFAAGQCHLRLKTLNCLTSQLEGEHTTLAASAPDVRGQHAYWTSALELAWAVRPGRLGCADPP